MVRIECYCGNEYENFKNLKEIGFFINEHDMDECEDLMICHLKLGVWKDTFELYLLIPKHSLHIGTNRTAQRIT